MTKNINSILKKSFCNNTNLLKNLLSQLITSRPSYCLGKKSEEYETNLKLGIIIFRIFLKVKRKKRKKEKDIFP